MGPYRRDPDPPIKRLVRNGVNAIRNNPKKAALAGLGGLLLFSGSDDTESKVDIVIWDVEHGDAMFMALLKPSETDITGLRDTECVVSSQ